MHNSNFKALIPISPKTTNGFFLSFFFLSVNGAKSWILFNDLYLTGNFAKLEICGKYFCACLSLSQMQN